MQQHETDAIERACERLMYRYCHLVDHGEASNIAELFTEDGECAIVPGHHLQGREAIEKGFASRQALTGRMSKHVCSTPVVEVADADTARGVVYLTLYRHDGEPGRNTSPLRGPLLVGEYHDDYRRTAAGWRIARRTLRIDFTAEDS